LLTLSANVAGQPSRGEPAGEHAPPDEVDQCVVDADQSIGDDIAKRAEVDPS
jgi:hypothetical protein